MTLLHNTAYLLDLQALQWEFTDQLFILIELKH